MSLRRKKKKCRLAGLKTVNKIRSNTHTCTRDGGFTQVAHTHIPRLAKPPRCTPTGAEPGSPPSHLHCPQAPLPTARNQRPPGKWFLRGWHLDQQDKQGPCGDQGQPSQERQRESQLNSWEAVAAGVGNAGPDCHAPHPTQGFLKEGEPNPLAAVLEPFLPHPRRVPTLPTKAPSPRPHKRGGSDGN